MPKVSPAQSNFITGEISPLLFGRVDSEKYNSSLCVCKNYIPMIQGGLVRRPGTYFVAPTKGKARLIKFIFSTVQAYMLEFGAGYIRFYRNQQQILLAGVPYEITSPYSESALFEIKHTQSADVLYITHPKYPPMKLTRAGHTDWTLEVIDFKDGPYQKQNEGPITLTPAATTGTNVTLTASAALFAATDVGRLVRIRHNGIVDGVAKVQWGYAKILTYESPTSVKINIKKDFFATSAVTIWRLGLWSDTTQYPATVTFHEDRLFFGGSPGAPLRGDGSNSSDYENFSPTGVDAVVVASNAISFVLNAEDVNTIRWMSSDEKGLQIGTFGNEFIVKASSSNEALNPVNISAKRTSAHGSADIQPVQVGKATMFVQSAGRKLRDMQYYYDVDGYRAADLTLLSEHITERGIVQLAFQKEPQQIIWAVRGDGHLIGMTYERDDQTLQVGWHRHSVGGFGDLAGNSAIVESVAVIPAPDATREELWLIVRRVVNGVSVRYVEFMTKLFENEEQSKAFFVDSGLSLDNPIAISSVDTSVIPVKINTTLPHGLVADDTIKLFDLVGAKELMGRTFIVTPVSGNPNAFTISNSAGPMPGTGVSPYVQGGNVRFLVKEVGGLTHLENASVSILADGAVLPDQKVVGGKIKLSLPAAVVHVGFGYTSDAQMNRIEAGSADGTALGKTRRIHRVAFLLHRSLGLKYGIAFDKLDTFVFRKANSDHMSAPPDLFSGIMADTLSADYDTENRICWRQDQPLPSTILAVMPQMVLQDRG